MKSSPVSFLLGVLFLVLSNFAMAAETKPAMAPKSLVRTFSGLIDTQYRDFKRCEDTDQARTKRRVRGLVLMKYVVNKTGKVVEASPIHNTTKSRILADCLIKNLELIVFPSPGLKPLTLTHAFKFRPGAVPGQK